MHISLQENLKGITFLRAHKKARHNLRAYTRTGSEEHRAAALRHLSSFDEKQMRHYKYLCRKWCEENDPIWNNEDDLRLDENQTRDLVNRLKNIPAIQTLALVRAVLRIGGENLTTLPGNQETAPTRVLLAALSELTNEQKDIIQATPELHRPIIIRKKVPGIEQPGTSKIIG